MKGNQPGLAGAVGLYLEDRKTLARPPNALSWDKGHGRIECREVWLEECPELGEDVAQEMGWPGLKWCGWWRRWRRQGGVEEEKTGMWIAGGALDRLTPEQVLRWLREHWVMENCVFRVRDVTGEDRLHGRKIGPALSILRSVGINFARWLGHRYVPDAQRHLSAQPDRGLSLVIGRRMEY